jgi:predicted transcriptional regulator of viral defense system
MTRHLLTIEEAATALGVSKSHIKRLISEAEVDRRSRWQFGREIVDMSPKGAQRRTLRINANAVVPGLEFQSALSCQAS